MVQYIRICILTLLGTLFLASSCRDPGEEFLFERKVIVNNQTDEEIMIFSDISDYQYIIEQNLMSVYHRNNNTTKLISANSAAILTECFWYNVDGTPHFDTLLVMILRRSTLDRYPFDYLLENNIYDDYFIFSYDELKSMNFQIVYKD